MTISASHASHIRRVYAAVGISSPDLDPSLVTRALHRDPTSSARAGDPRITRWGATLAPHVEGSWVLSSEPFVSSKDVNDHLRFVLDALLPHRDAVLAFAKGGEVFVSVMWSSTYLYAGTGPLIDATCIEGLAALRAGLGFDIYQVDEPEDNGGA